MDLIEPVIALPFFFALGAVFGSFGNVLIDRLPQGKWPTGRSHCDHCKRVLEIYELVPILSWLVLRGHCRTCRKPIPLRFTIMECVSAVLFIVAVLSTSYHALPAILIALALWAMLLIAVIDYHTQLIPDVLTAVIAIAGVLLSVLHREFSLLPVLIGGGFFAFQWLLSGGRWLGSGDVFLAVALSLVLGSWQAVTVMLFLSYIIGAVVAVALLLTGSIKRKAHIPFGPFLVIGAAVAFFWGDMILKVIFHLPV